MDVLIFDGRLDLSGSLHDHQVFLYWLHSMNVPFRQYPLSKVEKVTFATIKLTGQANQYWTDVVKDEYSVANDRLTHGIEGSTHR